MKRLSKLDLYNWILFCIPWAAYAAMTLLLFHRQSVHYAGDYNSDITPYIAYMEGIFTGYEFPYPIMFWIGKCFRIILNPEMAMAFAVTFLNALTPPILKYYADGFIRRETAWNKVTAALSTLFTFSLLFVSMLFLGLGKDSIGWRYRGVFSPNPFHNATYLATRPFSIVCFFMLIDLLQTYEKGANKKKYITFSLFLLLTTMAKPSFTFGFVLMTAVILLYRTCRKGFRNFKETMLLAACAVPTFIALIYQFRNVFVGTNSLGEETGIGIGWLKAWSMQEKPIGEALLLGLAFPLTVLLFNLKNLKEEKGYRLSVQMLITNLLMLCFLYEKGYRMNHVNFAWGYMHAMSFAYIMSLLLLFKNTQNKKQPMGVLTLQWGMYVWHLVCGIVYFGNIMAGGDFL